MSLLRPVDGLLEAYRRARTSASRKTSVGATENASNELLSAAQLDDGLGAFRTLAESLPEAVLYVDALGMCRAHNRVLEGLLRVTSADIHSQPLRELTGSTSYLCIEEFVTQALRGEEVWLRQVHPREDGSLVAFDAHYVPHRGNDGRVHGFVALLTPGAARRDARAPDDRLHHEGEILPEPRGEPANPSDAQARAREARQRIAQAIQARRFRLYRQEIVQLAEGGANAGAWEVLLRMKDSARRLIHPAAFLQIAESTGSLAELDRWVVNHLVQLVSAGPDDGACAFHINLCHDSLLSTSLAHRLRQLLERGSIVAQRMNFEINESDLARSRMNAMACLHALRMLGCRVGLDRFTGDTGMVASLIDLPIDFVKIDGKTIAEVQTSSRARTRVQVIVRLARGNGVRTIAEHVESAEVLEVVRALGVDAAQGYGVAMPEPFD